MADTVNLTDDQIEQLLQEAEAQMSRMPTSQNEKSLTISANKEVAEKTEHKTKSITPISTSDNPKSKDDDISVRVPRAKVPKKEFTKPLKWGELPPTELTPELKREFQLLRMRSVLDPKRHYKKDNSRNVIPKYSQVGTLVEGPTEFFSARMTKKERKRTLLEEVLETEDTTRRFKARYGEIQAKKTSGKKGYYKKMMQKRYGSTK